MIGELTRIVDKSSNAKDKRVAEGIREWTEIGKPPRIENVVSFINRAQEFIN